MTAAELRRQGLIDRIVRGNRDRLLRVIRSWVPAREDAEDILQDVLYQFTSSFDQIVSLERAGAWLYTTARNRITDFYRRQSRRVDRKLADTADGINGTARLLDDLLPDVSPRPEQRFDAEGISAAIIAALEALPAEQREVFIWHEIEGLSFREIAALTGVPVNTLLSRKRYAVLALREQLKSLQALHL